MLETVLVRRFCFSPSLRLRLITRSIYVGNSFLQSSQRFFLKSSATLLVRWNEGIVFVQDRRRLAILYSHGLMTAHSFVQVWQCLLASPFRFLVPCWDSLEGLALPQRHTLWVRLSNELALLRVAMNHEFQSVSSVHVWRTFAWETLRLTSFCIHVAVALLYLADYQKA